MTTQPDIAVPAPPREPDAVPAEGVEQLEIPRIPSEKVAVFLVLFYALALGLRIFVLHGPGLLTLLKHMAKPGGAVPDSPSVLLDYFLYMCFACQFFPIPTIPPIAFAAKAFPILTVAAVGAVGTCIANLNDYAILGWLFRHHRVKKVRDIATYRKMLRFFDKRAFLTLTVGAFLPIPVDVIRLLAISRAYPPWKYVLATFAGRFPRYVIIAYAGKELPVKYILILFLLTTLPAVVKFVRDRIRKRKAA